MKGDCSYREFSNEIRGDCLNCKFKKFIFLKDVQQHHGYTDLWCPAKDTWIHPKPIFPCDKIATSKSFWGSGGNILFV